MTIVQVAIPKEPFDLAQQSGQFLGVVAGPDAFADHESTLDIAVDSRDRILVADPARMQIRVFVDRKSRGDK